MINQIKNQKIVSKEGSNKTKERRNIYLEITNKIVEKMKAGKLLWKQGFRGVAAQNWSSKTTYSGIQQTQ